VLAGALGLAGCGTSSSSGSTHSSTSATRTGQSSSSTTTQGSSSASGKGSSKSQLQQAEKPPPPAVNLLKPSLTPTASQFPAANGRSLAQLGKLVDVTATLGAANGVFTPGIQRFAFGLTDKQSRYIYAPTAVYLASSPKGPAQGPFLAPDDLMGVSPQYRSQQNAGPEGVKAIYHTTLPLPHSGVFDVLAVSRDGHKLIGAAGEIAVAASSPIPAVGQRPPDIATDTLATVHGDLGLLTTRVPPESMHSVSFDQVLGKRPVALLFSTPALCISRVCGPVTDIMVELQHEYGNRITFIHEEVYVNNDPAKGLRPQLHAFHLQTEPWLYVIDRQGVITARLQGAFGVVEARQALESGLRS
jgi:hypothetical protein